jgi:hypothetical protein
VVFDYCVASTSELVGRPWRDWLRTYQAHHRGEHYLVDPGVQDITVQVCIDQLPRPTTIESQVEFLRRWGIKDLVDEGVRAWTAAASHPDVHALSMRSRKREGEALLDPSGLGGFDALTWRVGE